MSTSSRRSASLLALVPLVLFLALSALFYIRLGAGDPSEVPSALIGKPVPDFRLDAIAEVLRALALLSEQDGFERAVRSVSEAASRGLEDLDSLLAIHGHLHGEHPSDRMAIDEGILPNLPQLPKVPFQSEVYDSFLVAGGRLPC